MLIFTYHFQNYANKMKTTSIFIFFSLTTIIFNGCSPNSPEEDFSSFDSLRVWKYRGGEVLLEINKGTIAIEGNPYITNISKLSLLPNLVYLDLYELNKLSDFTPLANVQRLEYLATGDLMDDLSPLSGNITLRSINLSFNKLIVDLSPLGTVTYLSKIRMVNCPQIVDISPLSELNQLDTLIIGDSFFPNYIEKLSLPNAKRLKYLDIQNSKELSDISDLSSLVSLEYCNFENCIKIKSLPDLSSLKFLSNLQLRNCDSLQDITALQGIDSIHTINLSGCKYVNDTATISKLKVIDMSIGSTPMLNNLIFISNMTMLERLEITNINTTDISPLAALVNLHYLDIRGIHFNGIDYSPLAHCLGSGDTLLCGVSPIFPDSIKTKLENKGVIINPDDI